MRNKFLILMLCCFLLCGCKNYRELNDLAIITGMAIDKGDSGYKLSFLTANSQKSQTSSKEGEAQTTVYTGEGKNLSKAAKQIDFKNPKKLYLGHVNIVIISEEIGREGFLEVADWLLRYPETRSHFSLIQAKDTEAKEILKIVSPLEPFPSHGIATLLETSQDTQSVVTATDYLSFISNVLEPGHDPVLPTITIKGNAKKGSSQKNLESTSQKAYLKLVGMAVYCDDKFKGYTSYNESQFVNLLNDKAKEFKYSFDFNGDDVSVNSSMISSKTKVNSNGNVEVFISGKAFISEINSDTKIEDNKTMQNIEKKLNNSLKKDLNKTVKDIQTNYKCDIFGYGNKFYKKYPDKWKKMESKWNDVYFPNIKVKIKSDLEIKWTGALNRTIKGVKS